MKIFNSLTDKLEEFVPIKENEVIMYVCGPTVYNYVHIGNMRPVVTFDMVKNYLTYLGYNVKYASNFTDINDKIITAAQTLGITEREVADKFIEAFLNDVSSYNCAKADYYPRVIDNLYNIYAFIQKLIDKDYAYVVDENVYFRVSKIDDYGILSNQDKDELISGSRVDIDENKENPLDFALWRKNTKGEYFESPWGKGIPGWHTECVVMINSLFGSKIDIHGGGVDLKFPHHENEIAQSMALNNNHIANYWMHNGHINVNGVKMSKSLNNFVFANEFIKEHSANEIKIALFKTHYRLPLNFTDELFSEATVINDKVINSIKQAKLLLQLNNINSFIKNDLKINEIMDNDFNTPNLISYMDEIVKNININIRKNNLDELKNNYGILKLIVDILGLKYDFELISNDNMEIYKSWLEARKNKDFELADNYRSKLIEKGII